MDFSNWGSFAVIGLRFNLKLTGSVFQSPNVPRIGLQIPKVPQVARSVCFGLGEYKSEDLLSYNLHLEYG